MRVGAPMPSLEGATEWLNGSVLSENFKDSPTLVHFWAMSCQVCHDNMESIAKWRDQYADKGLKVVSIHMPREENDTVVEKVREEVKTLGITEPCAIDNQHIIGERFENTIWPSYYLFDAEGNFRGRAGGYAGISMIKIPLGRLLGVDVT